MGWKELGCKDAGWCEIGDWAHEGVPLPPSLFEYVCGGGLVKSTDPNVSRCCCTVARHSHCLLKYFTIVVFQCYRKQVTDSVAFHYDL